MACLSSVPGFFSGKLVPMLSSKSSPLGMSPLVALWGCECVRGEEASFARAALSDGFRVDSTLELVVGDPCVE